MLEILVYDYDDIQSYMTIKCSQRLN